MGRGPSTPQFWGLLSIDAYALCRRATKFHIVENTERRHTFTFCILLVPNLVFLGLSFLDLGPMYAIVRRQTASSLNAPAY